jgi:AcrR family transcriptional regulator
MESKGRTQEQRSAATRRALVAAARRLWAARGYAEVGTPEIAAAAGVTRGAMYHQFADKAALFLAVGGGGGAGCDDAARGGRRRFRSGHARPTRSGRRSSRGWTSAWTRRSDSCCCSTPRACWAGRSTATIAQRYSLGVTEQLLVEAMNAGQLARQPSRALAHILIGALDEAAMVIATAEDRDRARADVGEVLRRLFERAAGRGLSEASRWSAAPRRDRREGHAIAVGAGVEVPLAAIRASARARPRRASRNGGISASSHSARSSIPMPGGMKCAVPGSTASRACPMPCTSPMRPPPSSRNIATACSTTEAFRVAR